MEKPNADPDPDDVLPGNCDYRNEDSGDTLQFLPENGTEAEQVQNLALSQGCSTPGAPNPPGRKVPRKANAVPANFLLNFKSYERQSEFHRRRSRGRGSHHQGNSRQRSNPKPPQRSQLRRLEQFVQSNYRFAVNPNFCYDTIDPDTFVDWKNIDIVFELRSSDTQSTGECPICLDSFVTPKITRCGHLYCHVCILKHLTYSENRVNRCPLCSELVALYDLRSVDFRLVHPCIPGTVQRMRLISRKRDSIIATAHCQDSRRSDALPRVNSSTCFYSKVVVADEDYLLDVLHHEARELRRAIASDPDLRTIVNESLEAIKRRRWELKKRKREERQRMMENELSKPKKAGRPLEIRHSRFRSAGDATFVDAWTDEVVPRTSSSETLGLLTESLMEATKSGACVSLTGQPTEFRYFYQAEDSQTCFLHPLNVKCILRDTSNDLSKASDFIEGKVLEVERYTMDKELRRRYKFLSHLPVGCEFSFVELDLSGMISKDTLDFFSPALRARSLRRKRKTKATKRLDKKRVVKEQGELLRRYFEAGPRHFGVSENIDSTDVSHFPSLTEDDFEAPQATATPPGSAWGGASISSYAAITNNMGLFPELATAMKAKEVNSSQRPVAVGTSEPGASPKVSPSVPRGAWATSPPQDLINSSARSTSQRTRHPVVIYSNASGPGRR